jgi:hypothetical protein
MGLTFSVGDLSPLVQTIVSISSLIVAVVTLVILVQYARDTKTLAKSSTEQLEQSYVPYVTVSDQRNTGLMWRLSFINEGKAPAVHIEITYKKYDHELEDGEIVFKPITLRINDLAVGARPFDLQDRLSSRDGIVVKYESLTGQSYETKVGLNFTHQPSSISFRRVGQCRQMNESQL